MPGTTLESSERTSVARSPAAAASRNTSSGVRVGNRSIPSASRVPARIADTYAPAHSRRFETSRQIAARETECLSIRPIALSFG